MASTTEDARQRSLMKHFSGMIRDKFGEKRADVGNGGGPAPHGLKKLHWRVAASAIVFFQRFFLTHSFLDHDPRVIMLAAVLLAGKTEECRISYRDLHAVYEKSSPEEIQAAELLLLEALNFELAVEHPKSMVGTFIADFKRVANSSSSSSSSSSREWSAAAEEVVWDLQVAAGALRFSPAAVAVCALRECEGKAAGAFSLTFDAYLTQRFGAEAAAELLSQAASVALLLPEAREEVTHDYLKKECLEWLKTESKWSKARASKGGKGASASAGAGAGAAAGKGDGAKAKAGKGGGSSRSK